MSSADHGPDDAPSVEQQLRALQRESELRRAELHAIAAQLPEAMSRRAILRAIAADIRHAPAKGDIASRGVRKLGRGFGRVARSLKRLVARSAR